ncbi:MAG: hypothetical protein SFU85_12350 [Candidatus Methylacidiphilales bacterium]|nr:hypothetical protein [Candidatus Methylacidiphilales bacterium]
MSEEIQTPARESSSNEGTAKASIGAFALSIILHSAALLLVGGYVIFEGVVPKTVFNSADGLVDPGADETVMMAPPEEITEMPDTPQPTNDLAPSSAETPTPTNDSLANDLIISSAPSPSAFNISPAASVTSINSLSQNIEMKPAAVSDVSNPAGKQSVVQFFGIKAEARRVAFLLDASGSMVLASRGGKAGYDKLKQELIRMIQGLDGSSEFNVFIFDSNVDAFKPRAVPGSDRYKAEFATWIAPYMTNKFGNILLNYRSQRMAGFSGQTRMDLALTGAFESGCDTIFILTDGTPNVQRPFTEKENAEWAKLREKNAKEIAAWEIMRRDYYEKNKAIIAEMRQEMARMNAAVEGREKEWVWWIEGYKGLPTRPEYDNPPPGAYRGANTFTREELLDYLSNLYNELYKSRGQEKPTIHVVGYSVSDKDRDYLREITKRFGGNYRDFKGDK